MLEELLGACKVCAHVHSACISHSVDSAELSAEESFETVQKQNFTLAS
jgi:hypothetical protein